MAAADAHLLPLRRLILRIALVASSPFWMLTFLFLLLQKPATWMLAAAGVGTLVLALGLVAWLVARAKLRPVVEALEQVGSLPRPPPR